ncbi:MAG: sigma 54-interacting transcriptional regulator [Sandaracinaceae bacterium]
MPPNPDEFETLSSESSGDKRLTTAAQVRVPTATLVYHSDLTRVGERLLLLQPARGEWVEISRTEGRFSGPGAAPRPLDDPFLSRSPVRLRQRPRGALEVSVEDKHRAKLDGEPFAGAQLIASERLQAGVTLEFSKRVVLFLHETMSAPPTPTFGLVGQSEGMQRVRAAIANVADLEVPVLLRGETGVGKDRVARALHEASGSDGPFVAVNMANVHPNTSASELFGHVRGAFTGAEQARSGLFRQAEGGTLFLDEVGELHSDVQGMLLRALETSTVRPLGSAKEHETNVRVVSATDSDLGARVEEHTFRGALLHRLESYRIDVPPLRDRREDIPRLAVAFLTEELDRIGQPERISTAPKAKPWLHRDTMLQLMAHSWPGNVRQLRNVIRQLTISSRGSDVAVIDERVRTVLLQAEPARPTAPAVEERPPEDATLIAALARHRWVIAKAARELGLSRTSLYRRVESSADLRTGPQLTREELLEAKLATGGNLDRMSEHLRVSRRAVGLRLAELGIEPS